MFFEMIAQEVSKRATKGLMDGVLKHVHAYLADERAFSFAKEELRGKYEPLVHPASFEAVTTSLRLTKDDFLDFFKGKGTHNTLTEHLKSTLFARSDYWVYNRPAENIFSSLIDDFLNSYQRYFEAVDPHLSMLGLKETSSEILAIVSEIREDARNLLQGAQNGTPASLTPSIPNEIKSFLIILNIPFEIVFETENRFDVAIIDPSSIFPSKVFLSARAGELSGSDIEDVYLASQNISNVANRLILYHTEPLREIYSLAEARRISLQSFSKFRAALMKSAPREKFILGSYGIQAMMEALNVSDIYISPDAVPVAPSDNMEYLYFSEREPADSLVSDFLSSKSESILFVLGAYGSGKSAFCSHIMNILHDDATCAAAYFALNQLESADDILKTVTKGDQLARTARPTARTSVIILDGLDELPNAMRPDEKRRNMLRLLEASSRADKIIVTVRTSYFRGLADFWHFFQRADDSPFWSEIAKFLDSRGERPAAAAMILREFDTDQIAKFVKRFGDIQQMPSGFADEFLRQMGSDGRGFNYMNLARNPLYLFLLVNSRPWDSPTIKCLADIFDHFVRYWLQRDIAKGRSRWGISTEDRLEFMRLVAWRLALTGNHAMSYAEFDKCVADFLGRAIGDQDRKSIALDLQTTGVFNSVGDRIYFFTPSFFDYFTMLVWANGEFNESSSVLEGQWPKRLPTYDQAHMWAGYAEAHERGVSFETEHLWTTLGMAETAELQAPISWSPQGTIYPPPEGDWNWPWLNRQKTSKKIDTITELRMILNAVKENVEGSGSASIPILISNRRGLHARAAARWVSGYMNWSDAEKRPDTLSITIRKEEEPYAVNLDSIMGLMMLGAATSHIVVMHYSGCTRSDLDSLLLAMGLVPDESTPGRWQDAHEIIRDLAP